LGDARDVVVPKEVEFDRVAADLEDNGYGRSCRLCRKRRRSGGRYNEGDSTMNQISYHRREAIVLILRPPVFNRHIAAFNETSFAQPIEKGRSIAARDLQARRC
jgi:hypothetical protein